MWAWDYLIAKFESVRDKIGNRLFLPLWHFFFNTGFTITFAQGSVQIYNWV